MQELPPEEPLDDVVLPAHHEDFAAIRVTVHLNRATWQALLKKFPYLLKIDGKRDQHALDNFVSTRVAGALGRIEVNKGMPTSKDIPVKPVAPTETTASVAAVEEEIPGEVPEGDIDFVLLRNRAIEGEVDAQTEVGCFYWKRAQTPDAHMDDAQTAFYWFNKACVAGDVDAQINVGVCYLNGMGVEKDYAFAFVCFEAAEVRSHDRVAQYNLGICYHHAMGVELNHEVAYSWYLKAAEQGHAKSCRELGILTLQGTGAPYDRVEARKWFILAGDAAQDWQEMPQGMHPDEVAQAQRRAEEWRLAHALKSE